MSLTHLTNAMQACVKHGVYDEAIIVEETLEGI